MENKGLLIFITGYTPKKVQEKVHYGITPDKMKHIPPGITRYVTH